MRRKPESYDCAVWTQLYISGSDECRRGYYMAKTGIVGVVWRTEDGYESLMLDVCHEGRNYTRWIDQKRISNRSISIYAAKFIREIQESSDA